MKWRNCLKCLKWRYCLPVPQRRKSPNSSQRCAVYSHRLQKWKCQTDTMEKKHTVRMATNQTSMSKLVWSIHSQRHSKLWAGPGAACPLLMLAPLWDQRSPEVPPNLNHSIIIRFSWTDFPFPLEIIDQRIGQACSIWVLDALHRLTPV